MFNTITNTSTYTVVDIRKTFEGFSADFRMIAARTGKMSSTEVEDHLHDIMIWAEKKYLIYVDITLIDSNLRPIKATRYSVDENGKATQSDRAGQNDWQNIPNSKLVTLVQNKPSWHSLTEEQQDKFKQSNNFILNWGKSQIDNSYSHLSKENAQLYASKGYELKKENFK